MKSIDNLRKWSHRFDYTWIKLDGTMIFTTDPDYKCDDGENYGQFIRSMIDDIEYEIVTNERTCRCMTDDCAWCFACSECGKNFPRHDLHRVHNHGEINYCPNCGSKVVE